MRATCVPHMKQLRAKNYTASLGETPEVVVLFLPGETFFNAAVEQDPRIVEDGMADGVVLATPMTLFALLRAVAYGWTQEQLTENARRISELGREIYDRLGTMGGHFAKLGRELSQAVEAYNSTLSSLESRVLVSARRFADLGVGSDTKQVDILDPVSDTPRLPQADEGEADGRFRVRSGELERSPELMSEWRMFLDCRRAG